MPRQSGFTLIELLIASTILIFILLVGSFSFSLFANNWDKKLSHFEQRASEVRDLNLLNNVLDGIVPLALFQGDTPGFYFVGREKSLQAISLNGIFNLDVPVTFLLSFETLPDGKTQLHYRESPVDSQLILNVEQTVGYLNEWTLLVDVTEVSFNYYGWKDLGFKAQNRNLALNNGNLGPKWSASFSGEKRQLMPERIELAIGFDGRSIIIQSQLQQNAELFFSGMNGA